MDDKKFVNPVAEIVDLTKEDIITASNYGTANWGDGITEDWE